MSDNDELENIPVLTDVVEPGEPAPDPVDKVLAELPFEPLETEQEIPDQTPAPEPPPAISADQLQTMISEATDELREALLEDYQHLVQETLTRELDKLLAQYRVTLTERLSEQLDIRDSDSSAN